MGPSELFFGKYLKQVRLVCAWFMQTWFLLLLYSGWVGDFDWLPLS